MTDKPHSIRPEVEEALAAVRRVGTEEAMVAGVLLRHEIVGLLEQIEALKQEVDGMARAPYGEYQKMRERAERAEEQFDALKRQADFDAERASILSSAVGRARLILGDASKETSTLIDAAVAAYPAKEPNDG